MKTKTEKNYIYDGLGFPVLLGDVELVEYNGEFYPKIDVQKIADDVIKQIAEQQTRLTGNQVKFIRSYFNMSLRDFGDKVAHETHAAVRKWELKENQQTKMNENTELVIRIYILQKTKGKKQFFENYNKIQNILVAANDINHHEATEQKALLLHNSKQ